MNDQSNYRALVAELNEQATWWRERAAECKTAEGRTLMDGCALKLQYLIDRRDCDGNMKPVIRA